MVIQQVLLFSAGFMYLMTYITKLKKIGAFLTLHNKTTFYSIKHPRRDMIFFVLKSWLFMFGIIVFSFSYYTVWLLLPIWAFFIWIFYSFIKSWKYHGYHQGVLLMSTGVVLVLMLVVSPAIRNGVLAVMLRLGARM